jgi:D-3-phosphoglycerate dehydrogenase / 2-oxoglutarate reductase
MRFCRNSALLDALDAGLIAGAAVDVRAADQMPSPAVAADPKVIATPHVGGLTPSASEHQAMGTVRQVQVLLDGVVPVTRAQHVLDISELREELLRLFSSRL